MKVLTFDTETSDRWDFKAPVTSPTQPHLIQLALILEDFALDKTMAEIKILVEPDGWTIEPGAQAVHGISAEIANSFGAQAVNVAHIFHDMVYKADVVVAHNIDFDRRIMTKALADAGVPPIPWEKVPQRCTMKSSTSICKIPQARGGFKWPTLTEALNFFYGVSVTDAHDAMADAQACRRIHRALVERGVFKC